MIPSMNVSRQYELLKNQIDEAVLKVLKSGQYILSKEVSSFETEFARYCGVKYAAGVGNGTDALEIALRACGIGQGDEVITSAMSFFSTAEAIVEVGAVPVFADCTDDTYLIDADRIEEKITEKTKAILPVHLYGQCADMDRIGVIAEKYGLKIIEDMAQAAGAEYKGRKAGSMGDVSCVSFFPTKNLGGAGDGGMILTDNEEIFRKAAAYRAHGSGIDGLFTYETTNGEQTEEKAIDFQGNNPKYYNFVTGRNSRLDEIQAAMLNIKLLYLDQWNERRREIARQYNEKIQNPEVKKPYVAKYGIPVYYTYTISTQKRDELRKYLNSHGIATGVYFPIPLHLQKAFEQLGYQPGDMPNAEYVASQSLILPMFPELTQDEIDMVIEVVNQWI